MSNKPLSRQQIIDRVYNYFVTRRRPFGYAYNPRINCNSCVYSSTNGKRRCAVGIFIPPDIGMTLSNVWGAVRLNKNIPISLSNERLDCQFMGALQDCHDRYAHLACKDKKPTRVRQRMGIALQEIARDYKLQDPALSAQRKYT